MQKFISPAILAQQCGVTKRTVLYYNQIGVLNPKIINEKGERLYSTQQIMDLNLINALRKIDIPIDQIKKSLATGKDSYKNLYKHHSTKLNQAILSLNQINTELYNHYDSPQAQLTKFDLKTFTTKTIYAQEIFCTLANIPDLIDNLSQYYTNPKSNQSIYLQFTTDILLNPTCKISLGLEATSKTKPLRQYNDMFQLTTLAFTKAYSKTNLENRAQESESILRTAKIAKSINKHNILFIIQNRLKSHQKYINTQFIIL